ncbi:fumarylacetoacetate hydrolase family protein [Rathayibacter sp. CAU 1779]
MRIANLRDRLALVTDELALDVEKASEGRFGSEPQAVFPRWDDFAGWARGVDVASHPDAAAYSPADLGAPSPAPSQVFGIGLNYADHAKESGLALPEFPLVFTKFPSSVTGPDADVRLPGKTVDWEAELVVVIGRGGRHIASQDAIAHVAGFTVGQDLSERTVQWQGQPAQFSVGKSFEGFAPIGPVIVTLDEFDDPANLRITTELTSAEGETTLLQDGRTDQLIFDVPELVSRLSEIVELHPGDLIFTGTPSGVGAGLTPPKYLTDGDALATSIEGIGTIRQRFTR